MRTYTYATTLVLLHIALACGCTKEEPAAAEPTDNTPVITQAAQHGTFPEIPADAEMCEEHRVPEVVCPFCNQEFVEAAGFCGGHDVPEGVCTRCHPILIPAFKAENDWCDEHALPESQCLVCKGATNG